VFCFSASFLPNKSCFYQDAGGRRSSLPNRDRGFLLVWIVHFLCWEKDWEEQEVEEAIVILSRRFCVLACFSIIKISILCRISPGKWRIISVYGYWGSTKKQGSPVQKSTEIARTQDCWAVGNIVTDFFYVNNFFSEVL